MKEKLNEGKKEVCIYIKFKKHLSMKEKERSEPESIRSLRICRSEPLPISI